MKQFIIPKIKSQVPVAAVYKMIFDCGGFYVGGTTNIKQRMWNWKFKLNAGVKKNILVSAAFEKTSKIVFEIVEYVEMPESVKDREDFYIKKFWECGLLLNRAPSAFNGLGMKWTQEQIENRPPSVVNGVKIGKFDKSGTLIAVYESIGHAARENETSESNITRCLKKRGRYTKGFVFKKADDKGEFIEAPIIKNKVAGKKKGTKISDQGRANIRAGLLRRVSQGDYPQPEHSKPMIKYSMEGEELQRFPSIGAAAKSMGADVKNFKKQIKKGRPGYYKGFIWKDADGTIQHEQRFPATRISANIFCIGLGPLSGSGRKEN